MNNESALTGAYNMAKQILGGAGNIATQGVGAVVGGGLNLTDKALGNIQQDFQLPTTRQLPQGIQSPMAGNQGVVNTPVANSWLGVGMNKLGQGIQQGVGQLVNNIMSPRPQQLQLSNSRVLGMDINQPNIQPNNQPRTPTPTPTNVPTTPYNFNYSVQPTQQPTPTSIPQSPQGTNQITPWPTQIPNIDPKISQNFTDILNNHILPITRKYGIPDAVVAGQAAHESGYMQKPSGQYNYFGLKSNSHEGFASFKTPEDAAIYYAQTVKALVPNLNQLNSPLSVLQALQNHGKKGNYEGDNPNPQQYVYDVTQNPAWQAYGGGNPLKVNPTGWKT